MRLGQLIDLAHARGDQGGRLVPAGALAHRLDLHRIRAAVDFRSPSGGALDSVAVDIESSAVTDPALRSSRLLTLGRVAAGRGRARTTRWAPSSPRRAGCSFIPPTGRGSRTRSWIRASTWCCRWTTRPTTAHARRRRDLRAHVAADPRHQLTDPDLPIHAIGGLGPDSGKWMTLAFVKTALEQGVIGASLYDLPTTRRAPGGRSSTWTELTGERPPAAALRCAHGPRQYLITPGPTPIPPEVTAAMSAPIMHHRSPDFRELLRGDAGGAASGSTRRRTTCW